MRYLGIEVDDALEISERTETRAVRCSAAPAGRRGVLPNINDSCLACGQTNRFLNSAYCPVLSCLRVYVGRCGYLISVLDRQRQFDSHLTGHSRPARRRRTSSAGLDSTTVICAAARFPRTNRTTEPHFPDKKTKKPDTFLKVSGFVAGPAARNRTWISAFGGPNSIR